MKKSLILLLAFFAAVGLSAQEKPDTTYWKKGGNFSINFTQVSFTNWAAGGMNAVSGVAKLNYFANYAKGNTSWDNLLDLGYGLSSVEGIPLKKNEDRIDFQSKLGIKATPKWFYSGLLSFKSQFAPGYSDPDNTVKVSNLFAPAYLMLALGMDYKPSDKLSFMLSPVTGKLTVVSDPDLSGSYGVAAGETTRMELGGLLKAAINTEILKNVALLSELGLFTNYLDRPENVDVNWKLTLNMKINDYLSAQLNTELLYDADILDPVDQVAKVQFKELLGIGLSFKF
ncbi:MAG TPA: DUF3078 domain-containing protein [Prolixibacteraceae bacterium]|nr:DUF3078 domain-containing protein [Prolixibacteraceae bacterium]